MRFHFSNLERPKVAAKRLARWFPELPLSANQQAVAKALGYQSWHSLEREHNAAEPTLLDGAIPIHEARRRWTSTTLQLSEALNVPDGDIQAVLDDVRLTGNCKLTLEDHEVVRTACWRLGPMPLGPRRTPGTTCIITVERRPSTRQRAYIRLITTNYRGEKPVETISDYSAGHGGRADFEVICPRTPVADFVPLCLWRPYGWCNLADGTEVLFSREYKPLWRIRPDGKVERAFPWEKLERPFHWFNKTGSSWADEASTHLALERLAKHKITAMPVLADTLPILMANPEMTEGDAVDTLRTRYVATDRLTAETPRARSKGGQKRAIRRVCFDIETELFSDDFRYAQTAGGRLKYAPKMRLACAYDGKRFMYFQPDDVQELLTLLASADEVISFNGLKFDELVLRRHHGLKVLKAKHIDLCALIHEQERRWVSLHRLAKLNLGEGKHTLGRNMAELDLEGLKVACQSDVRQTYQLWRIWSRGALKLPGPMEREDSFAIGPGHHMPHLCPSCHAVNTVQLIEYDLDEMSDGQQADYLAGMSGSAFCDACENEFDWGM